MAVPNTIKARYDCGISNFKYDNTGVLDVEKLGGVLGEHQAGSVYNKDRVCPTLMAGMDHGNTMPYITEVDEWKKSD